MGRHKKFLLWTHFVPQNDQCEQVEQRKASRAQCAYCDWNILYNATRMQAHYRDAHLTQDVGEEEEDPPVEEADASPLPQPPPESPSMSTPKKQKTLSGFVERR